MGRYPVISISLKDVDGLDFRDAMKSMLTLLRDLFENIIFFWKAEYARKSLAEALDICSSRKFDLTSAGNMANAVGIAKDSLKFLSNMLFKECGQKAVILIDEYDVPLQKAKKNGYYEEMLNVIRGMLGSALKTNICMEKGFVTGCLGVAHQSIFTGINDFDVYGLNDAPYAGFIGLTKNETEQLLIDCGMESRLTDVETWYDGYSIAGNDMLCPWSVLKFLSWALYPDNNSSTFMPENHWADSSGNDIIELCMKHPDSNDSQRLQNLINGNTEEILSCEFTTYPDISTRTDFNTFATLMLHTGYFTYAKDIKPSETNKAVIRIPNEEIRCCFRNKAEYLFSETNPEWADKACSLRDALFKGDETEVQSIINDMLMIFISIRDASYESYYHGFLTGVLSIVKTDDIDLKSNQESGNGYSDLILRRKNDRSASILEFKRCGDDELVTRDIVCAEALTQIDDKKYDSELKDSGYTKIRKYGIAFRGENCTVKIPE